ncbi:MAG: non-canonical purine NTP pyrophosphatase [Candidatus Moraniibacteriota bacterium]
MRWLYKRLIEGIVGIRAVSLLDLGIAEKVDEIFETNSENAIHKAIAYGKMSGRITLAIDEAVTTNFLPENEQPGVYVRRFGGNKKELTDREVVDVWKKLYVQYPQKNKKFIWNFAAAFFNPENLSKGSCLVNQSSYAVEKFSKRKTTGYPMSAIMSPVKGGKSYLEFDEKKLWAIEQENFKGFLDVFDSWLRDN